MLYYITCGLQRRYQSKKFCLQYDSDNSAAIDIYIGTHWHNDFQSIYSLILPQMYICSLNNINKMRVSKFWKLNLNVSAKNRLLNKRTFPFHDPKWRITQNVELIHSIKLSVAATFRIPPNPSLYVILTFLYISGGMRIYRRRIYVGRGHHRPAIFHTDASICRHYLSDLCRVMHLWGKRHVPTIKLHLQNYLNY